MSLPNVQMRGKESRGSAVLTTDFCSVMIEQLIWFTKELHKWRLFCYDVEQFHKGFTLQRKYTIGVNYLSALFCY